MHDADGRPAISARNVTFSYGGPPVLEDASFTIERGDFASIVGPNGGGKTTLLKLILGLLQPARGEILVMNRPASEARPLLGYMPQQANLDPSFPINVTEIVLMGRLAPRMALGPFGREDRRLAAGIIAMLGLEDVRHRSLAELSGGQRKRVLIARALACQPKILLIEVFSLAGVNISRALLRPHLAHSHGRCLRIVVGESAGGFRVVINGYSVTHSGYKPFSGQTRP